MTKLPQHSSKSQEHYTPTHIVHMAKNVMGDIDLDPASSKLANKIINAKTWFGYKNNKLINGLKRPWFGRVFLNPPGGLTTKICPQLSHMHKSYPMLWWAKLVAEYNKKSVSEAVYVAFTLEQLCHSQKMVYPGILSMLEFPICYPKKRIKFDYPDQTTNGKPTTKSTRHTGRSPTHANAIVYLGSNINKFKAIFGEIGHVVIPK